MNLINTINTNQNLGLILSRAVTNVSGYYCGVLNGAGVICFPVFWIQKVTTEKAPWCWNNLFDQDLKWYTKILFYAVKNLPTYPVT